MTTLTRILDGNKAFEVIDTMSLEERADNNDRYRDLDLRGTKDGRLCAYDLFSLFTANIIEQNVTFVR